MLHTRGQNCFLMVLAAHRTVCQLHAQGRSALLLSHSFYCCLFAQSLKAME